jgi:hypothetical protein
MTLPEPERHSDTQRNLILNNASTKLEEVIWGHDPEIDTSINNGVWSVLDEMALAIEERHAAQRIADAKRIAELEADVARLIDGISAIR